MDIAAGLALALLALIAILPEYAVDFVFTAKAGQEFAETGQSSQYGPLALANMTGGNQLLIGLGWPMVILIGTWRVRKTRSASRGGGGDHGDRDPPLPGSQSVDIAYLTIASLYGLTLFLKDSLSLFDAVVLVTIYVLYLRRLSGAPAHEPHLVGPSAYVGHYRRGRGRIVNYTMFVVAAAVILLCAEPFAESIIELGEAIGVSEFLLVKWIAPTASEAPELLVATLFAWRLASRTGLGALISSKVNQWTLLVGTLPIVFSIFAGVLHGLPLDGVQRVELFVTAAQSVFAVAIVASRSVSRTEAWVMLGLFAAQLAESGLAELGHLSEQQSAQHGLGSGSCSSSPRSGSCARTIGHSSPTCATASDPVERARRRGARLDRQDQTPSHRLRWRIFGRTSEGAVLASKHFTPRCSPSSASWKPTTRSPGGMPTRIAIKRSRCVTQPSISSPTSGPA